MVLLCFRSQIVACTLEHPLRYIESSGDCHASSDTVDYHLKGGGEGTRKVKVGGGASIACRFARNRKFGLLELFSESVTTPQRAGRTRGY